MWQAGSWQHRDRLNIIGRAKDETLRIHDINLTKAKAIWTVSQSQAWFWFLPFKKMELIHCITVDIFITYSTETSFHFFFLGKYRINTDKKIYFKKKLFFYRMRRNEMKWSGIGKQCQLATCKASTFT